jgi:bifunctional ADP-heptose synthase (sugar kinase/adenylyltransferase)
VDDIVGADFVKSRGGRVVRVPLVKDMSSSNIIERIVERFC